jgi:hypothetical protein
MTEMRTKFLFRLALDVGAPTSSAQSARGAGARSESSAAGVLAHAILARFLVSRRVLLHPTKKLMV